MYKPAVLVVDDDPSIRKFIGANLTVRQYNVKIARDGLEALEMFAENQFDLIILDIMMPGLDGFEVCRRIKEKSSVAIMMLSAKDGESDKVRCLELGADDYLTKPFSLNELLLRVKTVLRRTLNGNNLQLDSFQKGDLVVDYGSDRVYVKGQPVNLTTTEYRLLSYLTSNSGRVISPQYILEKVWGQSFIDKPQVLWVNLSRLRRKLESIDPELDLIQTKPGMGYLVNQ
jgi:two-component system, OmpR family, KDP operon response regulator KdpE